MWQVSPTLRGWLELAYFVSGVLLAGAAMYALQQVRLMKQDIAMRSQRAARERAIEYIGRYFSIYVPLDAKFTDERKAQKLPSYDGPVRAFSLGSLAATYRDGASKRWALESWLPALNELHTIASAFAYGVADDTLGFQAIGRTFCTTVADKYDILCMARSEQAAPYYQGIVDLFGAWAPRLSESELSQIRAEVDHKLAALRSRSTKSEPGEA